MSIYRDIARGYMCGYILGYWPEAWRRLDALFTGPQVKYCSSCPAQHAEGQTERSKFTE